MTDYEDLAFKPAMTWEDLCEWVRNITIELAEKGRSDSIHSYDFFIIDKMLFYKDKTIKFYGDLRNETIAENISYDRMKTIIETLYGED